MHPPRASCGPDSAEESVLPERVSALHPCRRVLTPPCLADYTTSWTVHGFLEAAIAGNAKALRMIRAHMNVFNNHTVSRAERQARRTGPLACSHHPCAVAAHPHISPA